MITYSYEETDNVFKITFSGEFSEDDLNAALNQIAYISLVQTRQYNERVNFIKDKEQEIKNSSSQKVIKDVLRIIMVMKKHIRINTLEHEFNTYGIQMGKGVMFSEFLNQHRRISD